MKRGVEIQTDRLILRNWTLSEEDRDAFHFLMSDPVVRKFYVTRLTRKEADERLEKLVAGDNGDKFDWGAACLKTSGEPVGCTGLANVNYQTPFTPCVEIGWLYKPHVWGKGLATEAGGALLSHGFNDLKLDEIVAFAVQTNTASTAVMERLGMERDLEGDFNHPMVPDTYPHLQKHVLYRSLNRGKA